MSLKQNSEFHIRKYSSFLSIPKYSCLSNKTVAESRIRQEKVVTSRSQSYHRSKSGEELKQELEVETMVHYCLLTLLFHLNSCLFIFLIPPRTTVPGFDIIHSGLRISPSINYQNNAPQMCT